MNQRRECCSDLAQMCLTDEPRELQERWRELVAVIEDAIADWIAQQKEFPE